MSETTRPILGTLTTLFTPPAHCFSVQVPSATGPLHYGLQGFQGKTCLADQNWVSDDPSCWPSRTANAPNFPNSGWFSGWGFYSPGTLCPSGFTTACHATDKQDLTAWSSPQFNLVAGETAAGCCPSDYTCHFIQPVDKNGETFNWAQTCRSAATSTTIEVVPCTPTTDGVASEQASEMLPWTYTYTSTGSATSTYTRTVTTFEVFAPLRRIQINWRAEDVNPPTTSEIPGGAIAGIIIGALVGFAGVAVGVFWCVKKRRTNRAKNTASPNKPDCAPSQEQPSFIRSEPHTPQPLELLAAESTRELPVHAASSQEHTVELQG